MSDNIQVAIRLRPLNEREIKAEKSLVWRTPDQKTIFYIDNKATDQKYVFDRVYDCDESTYDIYEETVQDIVLAGIDGFNGTIFAYGQTSSGKTYTMSGTKNQMGIIPLAIQSIFTKINNSPDREFLLRVSYMEIYNEKITDLLDPEEKTLKMLEDENRQIVVSGLHEEVFRCGADVINLKKKGDARRRVAETARNEESSRSHAIFQIIIESQERQFNENDLVDESVRLSSLYFVDLAGSEKASENSGERFREGCAINKSLMTLGQVISKLSDGISNQHINYRDSKLTRLLQNGLGGNSKTAIICTINPTIMDETNSTLRFASRAKIIKNKPTINELTDTSDKAILKRYQKEITNLQQQLEAFKNQTPQKNFNPFYNNVHEQEKAELETKYQSVISKLKSMICVSTTSPSKKKIIRRETWCPGVLKRKLEQAGHLPTIGVIGTPSHVLGNILEETPISDSSENVIQPKGPVIYVNSACQTVKTVENDVILLKLENEMLQNQITMISTELTDLKARPAKQRRVSFENHDETKEFLELELQFAQEKNNHAIEEERKLEMERRKLKEERISHDESMRAFQAEKKQLMQRVEATESENSCLLKSLEHSQERVKNLEHELNYLQNQSSVTTGVKRCSMDRPLLNLSNITDRSKRSSRGDCEALKEQVFSLQSEVQMQETEIQKLTRDLDKCKEQLKNKFDEIRFLSLETTEQKEKIEFLQQENKILTQCMDDKTPVSELPEVKELNARLSEVSQEKHTLQQKLKSKSEEITYLSRQSAIYCEQIESKNACSSEENRKVSEEVEALKTKVAVMEAEKSQVQRDLDINKLYSNNLKDQLKVKTDECLLLQKNLSVTHEEVMAMKNTLVELEEQLLAKEELILELSQVKPSDISTQQSFLLSGLSPDQETVDSLRDQHNAKSKECENMLEHLKNIEGKDSSKSQDWVNIGTEDQNEEQDGLFKKLSNAQQEKAVLEEKYKQLMEEQNGMELLVAEKTKELSAVKQSLTEREKCFEEVELEMKAQLDTLRETCKVKEEECTYLNEQLTQTKREYDELAANGNEEKQVVLKAEAETQTAELANQLSVDHEKVKEECLELNEQVSALTEKLLEKTEKLQLLEKELEAQSQKCFELTESLKLAQELKQNQNVDEGIDGGDSDSENEIIVQAPASVADITLLDSLREELDAKREECDRLKELTDMDECEVLKQELKTLKLENENMILACSSLREQMAELEANKKHKEELLDSLVKESEKKSQDYEILSDEMKTIQMENDNKMLACTSLSEKVSTLKQERSMAEEILKSLQEELNVKVEEIGWLNKELEDFKRNSNSKCNECEKLAEQLSILKAKTVQEVAVEDNKRSSICREETEIEQVVSAASTDESKSVQTTNETDAKMYAKDTISVDEKQVLDLLREELQAKTEECASLSAQLQEMREKNSLQQLTMPTQDNNEELSLCKHQLEDKIEECCQLKEELANIRDDYHVLKMSLEGLQDSSQLADTSIQNQLSECQAELESQTQECTSLGKKLSEMDVVVCSKTEECRTLNEKISTLEQVLDSKTKECESLTEKLETLNAVSTLKTEECRTLNENISSLEQVLSSKTKECESLTEKLEILNAAPTIKTEESSSLLQQVHSIEGADSAQQSLLDSKIDKSTEISEELEQLCEQCNVKTSECEDLSKQICELKKNYEHIEGSLAEEILMKSTLQMDLEIAKSDLAILQEEMNRQTTTNFFLGQSVPTDDDKQVLVAELETRTQECSMLSEEMDNLKKEFENLKSQKENEAQTMRCSLEELETKSLEYDVLVEEIKRSSLNSTEFQNENKDLHEEIVKKTNQLEEMKGENVRLMNSFEQEQENLAIVSSELTESLSELENLRRECNTLKEDLAEMNSKTNDLQESLRYVQEQEQLAAKKLSAKSIEFEQLSKDLSNAQKECESLKMSLLSLDEENNRLSNIQKDLHATQSSLDAKINECSVLSQHIEALTTEIESLKVSLLNLNDENQQLLASKEKMVSLQSELDTKSQDCERLLEEVTDLKTQKHDAHGLVARKESEILNIQNELESKQAELKEQLAHQTKKISELDMENMSLRESLIKLDEQNDKLSNLNDCFVINEKKLVSKSEECAFLSAELEAANASKSAVIAEVESKLESKTQEYLKLTKEMSALQEQTISLEERLSQELEIKCKEYALLSSELMTEKQNKMEIQEEMQLKLSAKTEECSLLSKQVINLEKEHKDAVTCLEEKLVEKSQQCDSLSTKLSDLLQKHSNLEELLNSKELSRVETGEIEVQLKLLIEEYGTLKEKLQAEEEKVKSLASELESQNKSLEYKEEICKFLYESNTKIKTEMDQLKDQIASQNKTINNSSLQITELSINPTEELTLQMNKTQEEKDSNKSVIKKLKWEIIELKDKLEDLEGKAHLCEILREEIKAHLNKIETLSTENKMKTEIIDKLKTQDSNLNYESNEDLVRVQNELEEKTQECQDLCEQLKTVQTDLMEAKAQLSEKQNEVHELKLKEFEEKMEKTKLEADLEIKPEISMVSMNATEDLTELTQQLKKAMDEKDSHKSVAKKLKIEIIQLKDKLEDLEGSADLCQILREEIKAHLNKIETLSTENKMKTEIIDKLKTQDSNLNYESNEDLVRVQNELEEKTQECRDLCEQLKTVQTDLMEAKAQLSEKQNEVHELKLKEFEERMEKTRLTKLEAELEIKPEISMVSINATEDLTELTQQLKKALDEKDSHKSVAKKLKIEKIELKENLEDLEGKAKLCKVLQEENQNHVKRIETLSSENTKKNEIITKLESDVQEKQECIHLLERTSCDLKAQELENLQQQLSKQSMDLVWAQSAYKLEMAQSEKMKKSYEETNDILNEKIKSLKEDLRLLQTEEDEATVRVPNLGCKRARSSQAENAAVQSQGFIDHMAFVTMEAENAKLNRKIESLKQKLSNSLKNHEEVKQELQTFKEKAEKENTPSKRKKAEKSTNTEILKLSESNTASFSESKTPTRSKLPDTSSPSKIKPQRVQLSTEKDECRNQ